MRDLYRRRVALVLTAVALLATPAHAAEIVWSSAGGGTWTTTGNWVGGVVPTSTDTVAFRGWAPLIRTSWTVTGSHGASASNMKDGSRATTWTSGLNQDDSPIQYVTINLGSVQTFGGIEMQSTISTDYPRAFAVHVSTDGSSWGTAIASGTGSSSTVSTSFSDQTFQYIKIQLTTTAANYWQMAELYVFGTAGGTQLATGSMTASSSAEVGGVDSNVLDFNNGTVWSPGANQVNGQYIQLDLGADRTFDAISMDAYSRTGDYPNAYKVEVAASATPSTWVQVATGTPTVAFVHVTFSSQTKRYIKITQTGSAANWWSMYELRVYGTPTTATTAADITLAGIKHTKAITFVQASGHDITVTGAWNQSAGTFTGGNSPISIGDDFNLSGGTFTSTSDLLKITGSFNKSGGGPFNNSSGRVLLNSTGTETLSTDGAIFNDLIINDALVVYWPFDESASPAANASGYTTNATWAGSTTSSTTVPSAPALNFTNPRSLSVPGNNSYAQFTAPDVDAMTIAAWVYSTTNGEGSYPRIVEMPGYALFYERGTGTTTESVGLTVFTNGIDYSWRTPVGSIGNGVWYHIAATFNGSNTATIYINGVSQTLGVAGAGTGTNDSNTGGTGIGYLGNLAAFTRDWNGYFDDFRIYNRVLTATEVADLYSGSQRTAPLGTHTLSGTGTFTVADDLVIASGTLDASAAGCSGASCSFIVEGDWLNLGGTFTPRTGTVTLNGTGAGGVLRSDRVPFYNLTISNTGTWTMQDRLFIDNTLAISAAGTLAQSSSNYDIHAGTLNKTAGTISGSGDVVLDATSAKTLIVNSLAQPLRIESPLDSGLVGYWQLDEGRGATAYDVSGNAYNGTLTNGPIWSTSVPGTMPIDDAGSLSFNSGGSESGRVTRTATLEPASVTVAAWIKRSGTQIQYAKAIIKTYNNNGTTPFQSYSLQMNKTGGAPTSGQIYWDVGLSGAVGSAVQSASNALVDGAWTHVVGVYDPAGTAPQQRLYINGSLVDSKTLTTALMYDTSSNGDLYFGQHGGNAQYFNGSIDDVRIYNRGLSANEVSALYTYGFTTGSPVVYSLGATATMSGTLKIVSGILDAVSFQNTITGATTINGGEYRIGSNTNGQTFTGGLQVNRYGELTLASANGKAIMGSGTTFVMDGTLTASSTSASIQSASTTYTFNVGSVSGATPTLDISGLQVKNTTANGMYINANTGASTTFTRFDNIAFSNGAGAGSATNYNLQIYATELYLTSTGCTFDSGVSRTVGKNVKLVGDGGATATRVVFGGATCASNEASCEAYDGDDDATVPPDGIGESGGGAVVQWLTSASTDTSGSIEGFPTAAFDWSDFSYYSTYVAYHDTAGGTADTVYVRSSTGAAEYSWSTPSLEEIIGTPRWDSTGPVGSRVHHVYVSTTGGKVYHLIDNGSSLVADTASPWDGANNPFNCSCTITTPLAQNTTHLFWGGIQTATNKLWTLSKTSTTRMPGGSPLNTSATTQNTAPAIWASGNTFAFLGLAGRVSKIDTTTQANAYDNVNPGGSTAVTGRITIINNKLYAGDDNGSMWCLDPGSNFDATSGTWKHWGYTYHSPCAGVCQIKSSYFDPASSRIYFGDQDGHLFALNSSGTVAYAWLPWRPGTSADAFVTAPLFVGNVVLIGTTTGTLYIIDQNYDGTQSRVIQTYKFGSSTKVSGIAYDASTSNYMISTANDTTKDGKVYFLPVVTDPTPSFQ